MPPGVKGLAAMFEQRGDSNPSDDRGRSPGPGMTRSIGGMYMPLIPLCSIFISHPRPPFFLVFFLPRSPLCFVRDGACSIPPPACPPNHAMYARECRDKDATTCVHVPLSLPCGDFLYCSPLHMGPAHHRLPFLILVVRVLGHVPARPRLSLPQPESESSTLISTSLYSHI